MAKRRILVVEDEAIVAEDIRVSLEEMGYEVPAVVSTGEEAVRVARELRPDLVLMDIVLGGKVNGINAAGDIRSSLNIPVVYLTAYSDEKTLERAKLTEPFGYIIKPFDERELRSTIETTLYKHEMEERLRESREWLRVTLRSIGDAVIATDRDARVIFMNPQAEALTGWKESEAMGKALEEVFNIINELTGEKAVNPVGRILKEGVVIGLANHTVLISRDGRHIPIEDSGAPIKDRHGETIGVVMVFHDVTEKRRMESALRESEQRYKDLFDNAHDMIHSVDIEGRIIFANKSWLETLGYEEEDLKGLTIFDILHPDSVEHCREVFKRVLSGEPQNNVEATFITKDGRRIDVLGNISCRMKDGKVIATQGIFRDVTEQKRAEAILRRAAQEWRETFDAIPDFISVFDKNLRFMRANKALANHLRLRPEELIGKHCYEVYQRDRGSDAECLILKARDLGETITAERHYPNFDFPLLVTVSPIKDKDGNVTGFVHVAKDISELKKAEEKIREESEISHSLLKIVETLNTILDERQLIRKVIEIVPGYLRLDILGILLYDTEHHAFVVSGTYGLGYTEERLTKTKLFKEGDFPAIKRLLNGEGLLIEDLEGSELVSREFIETFGIKSAMLMPIFIAGRVKGFIVGGLKEQGPLGERERALLKGLSDGLGVAIHNSRLYKESTERFIELSHKVETIKAMAEIDKEILSAVDRETVLNTSIAIISRVIPCDRVSVLFKEKKKYKVIAEWGVGSLKSKEFQLTDTQVDILEHNQSPLFISDLSSEAEKSPYQEALIDIGIQSAIVLPLVRKARTIGIIDICSLHPAGFLPANLRTAEDIVSQIAVALENASLYEDLQQLVINIITSFASMLDAKSPWTRGHSERVTRYALAIVREMGLGKEMEEMVKLGGLLHDIGKIGTYDVILDKAASLSSDETQHIREHPLRGAMILKPIRQLKNIIPMLKYHHERVDGTGYPEGLRGEEIPLLARILCVADAYDAMTSDRPYRSALGKEYAISELKRCAGTQFDPQVVEAFIRYIKKQESGGSGNE
jgi:PAS domain S-box-containing protein/putative nucleotidyltransferase with HDIG domain